MNERILLHVPYEAAGLSAPEKPAGLLPVALPHSDEIGEQRRPAVIICPGGGYDFCSDREAVPVAARFAGYGVQAFVLYYNCKTPFPTNLLELAEAVRLVRAHAAEYEIDPHRIAVCGFSAGAHLAGSLAVYANRPLLTALFGDSAAYRPDAQILCYPVISGGACAHRGSIINLIGVQAANDFGCPQNAAVSLEQQVSAETPPCFLWSTSDDNTVPIDNSLLYLRALAAHDVPFESHILPHGAHGLSLADETAAMGAWHLNPVCAPWFEACIRWIRRGYQ